jgi:hypothetical protein
MNSNLKKSAIGLILLSAMTISTHLSAQDSEGEHHKPKHHQYKLIDLGTLGGPDSGLSGPQQRVLNSRGKFVAFANTGAANPNPGSITRSAVPVVSSRTQTCGRTES